MKELTDAEKLEIATRLMSSTNHALYVEACELMEGGMDIEEAIDGAIEHA